MLSQGGDTSPGTPGWLVAEVLPLSPPGATGLRDATLEETTALS